MDEQQNIIIYQSEDGSRLDSNIVSIGEELLTDGGSVSHEEATWWKERRPHFLKHNK